MTDLFPRRRRNPRPRQPEPTGEILTPAEQGLGLDEEPASATPRQQPTQPRKQCPIAWLKKRSGNLAAEHGHLVAKHHDLDGEFVTFRATQPKDLEQSDERHVEEGQGHGAV